MAETTRILTAERDGDDGLIATFSDGTTAGYVAEELLLLRPIRERVDNQANPRSPQNKLAKRQAKSSTGPRSSRPRRPDRLVLFSGKPA